MNILFYRYGSICEPDLIAGFEELGFQVSTIEDEIYNKNISSEQCIHLIDRALQKKEYAFLFSINYYPAISAICNIYNIPYLCWIVDSPIMELYSNTISNSCNRIFLFDRVLYDEFSPYNPTGIFHLPLATNVTRWDHTIAAADHSLHEKFRSTLSFVGSLYTEKCLYDNLLQPPAYLQGYLNGLMEAQLRVYGYYFIEELLSDDIVCDFIAHMPDFYSFPEESRINNRAAVAQLYLGNKITALERTRFMQAIGSRYSIDLYTGSDTTAMPVHNQGRVKTLTEMPLVFRNSQINLNLTSKAIRSALPLRIWDILGCGGFCLSNYQIEIPEHFIPGEDIALFDSEENLLEQIHFYLERPTLCQEIAENAHKKVSKHHTYPLRLTQMLELAFQLRQ